MRVLCFEDLTLGFGSEPFRASRLERLWIALAGAKTRLPALHSAKELN